MRLTLILIACALHGAVIAGEVARRSVAIDPRIAAQTIERDDREAGSGEAAAVCSTKVPSRRYRTPVYACFAAYEEFVRANKMQAALAVAVVGCEKYANFNDCRRLAGLPLVLDVQDDAASALLAKEIARMADFVCLSGQRFLNVVGKDVTGSTCNYMASQFVFAENPEYIPVFNDAARKYYASIHQPETTARLQQVACQRWGYAQSCATMSDGGAATATMLGDRRSQ